MSLDLTGIENRNEYYTNHYFTTMFEDGASDQIKIWNEAARNSEIKTPWAMLRENIKQFYPLHDRYTRGQSDSANMAAIRTMADLYLQSLGYGSPETVRITLDDGENIVPIYREEVKANNAPLLWIALAYSKDSDSGIMESYVFDPDEADNDNHVLTTLTVEELAAKLLFHSAEPPRFLIVISLDQIVLIDRNKWNEKRYIEFDLEEIFGRHETTTLQAMSVLLHHDSLCPADGNALIDSLDEQSRRNASGVSQDLKYALRESIEILGNEVLYDLRSNKGINNPEKRLFRHDGGLKLA